MRIEAINEKCEPCPNEECFYLPPLLTIEGEVVYTQPSPTMSGRIVKCWNCGMSGPVGSSGLEAIRLWNKLKRD